MKNVFPESIISINNYQILYDGVTTIGNNFGILKIHTLIYSYPHLISLNIILMKFERTLIVNSQSFICLNDDEENDYNSMDENSLNFWLVPIE